MAGRIEAVCGSVCSQKIVKWQMNDIVIHAQRKGQSCFFRPTRNFVNMPLASIKPLSPRKLDRINKGVDGKDVVVMPRK